MPFVWLKRRKCPKNFHPASGRRAAIPLAIAVLLACLLGGSPRNAWAQAADDDERSMTGRPATAGDTPGRQTPAAGPVERRPTADRDDEDEDTAAEEPAAKPGPGKPTPTAARPGRKPGTAAADDDPDEEALPEQHTARPAPARRPASAAKNSANPVPPTADRDDGDAPSDRTPAAASEPAPFGKRNPEQADRRPARDEADEPETSGDGVDSGASVDSAAADLPAHTTSDPCSGGSPVVEHFHADRDYRSFVAGVAGAIPAFMTKDVPFGSFLGGAIKLLWPDNTADALFEKMKTYVNAVVKDEIAQEHVSDLQMKVQGIRDVFARYDRATNPLDKGSLLNTLLGILDSDEPYFFDPRKPEKTLAEFVAFGTLKLEALREKYLFAANYYGSESDNERAAHLAELQETAKRFTDGAHTIRERAMRWRLGKIESWSEKKFVGWRGGGRSYTVGHTEDKLCGWSGGGGNTINVRTAAVKKGFSDDLDVILEPTKHWGEVAKAVDRPLPSPVRPSESVVDNPPRAPKGELKPPRGDDQDDAVVPCMNSPDPDVREGIKEPGIRCRRENIDKFLATLKAARRLGKSYSHAALETCLRDLRAELLGQGRGRGGAGAYYYQKLVSCRQEAERDKIEFNIDTAAADDDTRAPEDADCDATCVDEALRKFMAKNPEPAATDDE
jgi:hypothetical protein